MWVVFLEQNKPRKFLVKICHDAVLKYFVPRKHAERRELEQPGQPAGGKPTGHGGDVCVRLLLHQRFLSRVPDSARWFQNLPGQISAIFFVSIIRGNAEIILIKFEKTLEVHIFFQIIYNPLRPFHPILVKIKLSSLWKPFFVSLSVIFPFFEVHSLFRFLISPRVATFALTHICL
jgi:hypothetical protein